MSLSLLTSPVSTMLPVTDTDRAREFYDRLDLPFVGTDPEGGAIYQLAGDTVLVLLPREAGTQNPSTALSWRVDDVRAAVADLESRGITFEDYDLPGLQTVDHVAEVGGTRSAWFLDPDGNVLCVHEGTMP